ncbi:unnamed protein product, partial [Symbiodinium sp. CCMP2456]
AQGFSASPRGAHPCLGHREERSSVPGEGLRTSSHSTSRGAEGEGGGQEEGRRDDCTAEDRGGGEAAGANSRLDEQ